MACPAIHPLATRLGKGVFKPPLEEAPPAFVWSMSDTLALARTSCVHCSGLGLRSGPRSKHNPCNCVLRAIFRICLNRYRYITASQSSTGCSSLQVVPHGNRDSWSRRNEEYLADFYLVAKRCLDDRDWFVFVGYFVLGEDWRACCRHTRIDRGLFFHAVYRIERKLGRAYRELRPYSLFPIDQYFGGTR